MERWHQERPQKSVPDVIAQHNEKVSNTINVIGGYQMHLMMDKLKELGDEEGEQSEDQYGGSNEEVTPARTAPKTPISARAAPSTNGAKQAEWKRVDNMGMEAKLLKSRTKKPGKKRKERIETPSLSESELEHEKRPKKASSSVAEAERKESKNWNYNKMYETFITLIKSIFTGE